MLENEIDRITEMLWAGALDVSTSEDFNAEGEYEKARDNVLRHYRAELLKAIKEAVDQIIGEDMSGDIYGSLTRRKDGSIILLSDEVIVTNQLKAEQRARAKALLNELKGGNK